MRYRENGDLERMQRFWFTGACEPRKRRRTSSKPLALAQVSFNKPTVQILIQCFPKKRNPLHSRRTHEELFVSFFRLKSFYIKEKLVFYAKHVHCLCVYSVRCNNDIIFIFFGVLRLK